MKYQSLAPTALLIPCLLAFTSPGGKLEFAPEAGSTVTKTFTQTWAMSLDDMEMLMNGQDSAGMMPEFEMDMTMNQTVQVADTYGEVEGGRPSRVDRAFKRIGQDMDIEVSIDMMGEVQEQNQNAKGSSELEGQTVVFEWDADEEGYTKKFADEESEVDTDKLEGLVEDMDLRVLLPKEAVAEGDEWNMELKNLVDLLAPGGDLAWDMEMDGVDASMMGGPDPAMMGDMREMMGEMLEGEATVTFAGVEDGLGILEISIEIDTARDMTDMVADMMAEAGQGMTPEIDRMDIEISIEATGKAKWDMQANHIKSYELKGDLEFTMDMEMSMDMGQAMTIEMSMSMSGTLEQAVEVE